MKLQIDTDTKIRDIQKKFTEVYPFLKVEFYKEQYSEKKVSALKDRISPDKNISEQGKFFKAECLDINRHRTVADFEKEFYEKFGIAMQVSRKSGNSWIETSKTDDRTLKAQNQLGKTMSSQLISVLSKEEFER
jgi:glycerol-3-phosphate O-acyltransferase